MKKVLLLAILCILMFLIFGCGSSDQPEKQTETLEKISVRIPWLRTAATAGLEVAADQGFFKEEGLIVEIKSGSVEASPLRKVLTKEDHFGILEPAQVLVGITEQRMPLVILAMKMQKSPFCLMFRADKGIDSIQDIKGKRVGYNPLNDLSYLAMLNAGNINRKEVNEIRVQFNLQPFLQDQVDVWPSYISNEPVVARSRGLDVDLICADDIGVHLFEHAIFARQDFIENNPEIVESFLRAWIKGWQFAIAHPDRAVDIVMERTEGLDKNHESKVLEIINGLITSGQAGDKGIAWVSPEMIDGIGQILFDLDLISQAPSGEKVVNNQFIEKIDRSISANK